MIAFLILTHSTAYATLCSEVTYVIKISKLQAPAVAGVVKAQNAKSAIAEIKNCQYDRANMIDLHMPCLEDTSIEALKNSPAGSM